MLDKVIHTVLGEVDPKKLGLTLPTSICLQICAVPMLQITHKPPRMML
jgi:hypothetical protein